MQMTLTAFQWLVRVAGVLALILGLLLWTSDVPSTFVPIHMLLGVLTVLGLWLLAATASQMGGASPGLLIGAGVLGLVVAGVGFSQQDVLPGGAHWIIQVVHLVLGMAAVATGEMIGGRVRRHLAGATP